ncbi:MAG: YitT family protein, partial [Exiguobacterium chiriqhucha]
MKRDNRAWLMGFQIIMNIIGGMIAAYGLESVLIPNSVSDGGITGISIVVSQLTGV